MLKIDKSFYIADNEYDSNISINLKKDIRKYIYEYEKDNYYEILKKDIRTEIYNIFSTERANIIKWYDIDKNNKLLEVGANYGEITQELVKKSNNVTSIEFTKDKIECIAERLKNSENLELMLVSNITDVRFKEKFDYITFIGISEYATKIGFKNFLQMIQWGFNNLKEDGKIILALDNKFGVCQLAGSLKYENEIPFACYKSYVKKDYELFGKDELVSFFDHEDINYKFYYPVPNYKLTHMIYSNEYMPQKIQYNIYYKDYENIMYNELNFLEEVKKNNKFDFFTNSYLIELSKLSNLSNIKYVRFSNIRKPEFKVFTKIDNNIVEKIAQSQNSNIHITNIENNIKRIKELNINTCDYFEENRIKAKYIPLNTLDVYLNNLIKNNQIEIFFEELDKWIKFLKDKLKIVYSENSLFKKYNIKVDVELEKELTIIENRIFRFDFPKCFL